MTDFIEKIETDEAPPAVGPYSQAVCVALNEVEFIYVSGQLPMDAFGKIVDGDIKMATRKVFDNIKAILKAAGALMSDVVKVEIFLMDLSGFKDVNDVYRDYFPGPIFPARQTIEVSKLPFEASIEISCVAVVKNPVITNM